MSGATENRAANVPAPAAPKAAVKKSRICKFENCTRYVVNRGLCIGHGVSDGDESVTATVELVI
jgi:surface antigen